MGRLTERTLYPHIINTFRVTAEEAGIKTSCGEEIGLTKDSTSDVFPDIFCKFDGETLFIQVKIGKGRELLDDLVKIYPLVKQHNAALALLLYPEEVRSIPPEEVERTFGTVKLPEAHIASHFLASSLKSVTTYDVARKLFSAYKEFQVTKIPTIDYMTIATICRESIVDLSTIIRRFQKSAEYKSMVQAIVGSFDFYKSMLSEMVEKEEVMETYIADIAAYLAVIHLLLSHVFSTKLFGRSILPPISNSLSPPAKYTSLLLEGVVRERLHEKFPVLRAAPDIFRFFATLAEKSEDIDRRIAKLSYGFLALRPEHVKEELLGRIFQEGLPPETRKNLGAFFTKPEAAQLLASISIESWDEKVLDPACGSGTLLTATYRRKEGLAKIAHDAPKRVEELHRLLLDQITGIDVMVFAREIASANLAATHITIPTKPRIYSGDGILKMREAVEEDPDDPAGQELILKYLKEMEEEYRSLALKREGYDVVIMNPPFTAWKRIPANERAALKVYYGNIIQGDVGYWAYFFLAADNVIRAGGKLAAVTPEEFFAGESAGSLRAKMLLGKDGEGFIYVPVIVVKSATDVAFSEGTLYRDYLVVFKKVSKEEANNSPMILAVLKRKLDEINERELEEVSRRIRISVSMNDDSEIMEDDLVLIKKITNSKSYMERCPKNLKPLVAYYTGQGQRTLRRLIEDLLNMPKLSEIAELSYYRPGPKGSEEYTRRLFLARYGGKGKTAFRIIDDSGTRIKAQVMRKLGREKGNKKKEKAGKKPVVTLLKNHLRPSLRSPAGVPTLSLSNKSEWVIVDMDALSLDEWRIAGFVNQETLVKSLQGVRTAYEEKATKLLVSRRLQVTSPNIFWLVFYSPKPVLTTEVLVNYRLRQDVEKAIGDHGYRALALYLNSSCALASILAYYIETRGAWGDLHPGLVWDEIPVPDLKALNNETLKEVELLFKKVANSPQSICLLQRLEKNDPVQRSVDELSLKMLGMTEWRQEIGTIQNSVASELKILDDILKTSSKEKKAGKRTRKEKEEAKYQKSLNEYY